MLSDALALQPITARPLAGARLDLAHPLARGLFGCYPFVGGGGHTVPNRVGPSLYTGTVGSSVLWTGPRATFDGTANGYVDLGGNWGDGNTPLSGPTGYVITWVFVDLMPASVQPSGTDAVFWGRASGAATVQMDYLAASQKVFVYFNGGSFTSSTALSLTRPQSFAVTVEAGATVTAYVDGVADGSASAVNWNDALTVPYRIGMRGGDNAVPWSGQMGGVLIYTRALAVLELQTLAKAPWCMLQDFEPVLMVPPAPAAAAYIPYDPWPQLAPILTL